MCTVLPRSCGHSIVYPVLYFTKFTTVHLSAEPVEMEHRESRLMMCVDTCDMICGFLDMNVLVYRTASNVGRPLTKVVTPRNTANDFLRNLMIKSLIDYL